MGLRSLLQGAENGILDNAGVTPLNSYPNHFTTEENGGFNYNNSTTPIFDGTGNTRFRQKSFEFGKFPAFDRPNLGFSPEPFIKGPILNLGDTAVGGILDTITDGFIRGGAATHIDRNATDVVRITRWGITPQGLLWNLKQVGLQRSNPRVSEPVRGVDPANARNYNPANTLAQIGVEGTGIRFRRDGALSFLGINSGYADSKTILGDNEDQEADPNSKLTVLFNQHILTVKEHESEGKGGQKPNPNAKQGSKVGNFFRKVGGAVNDFLDKFANKNGVPLYAYSGGPNSLYGIGNTTIRKYAPFVDEGNDRVYGSQNTDALLLDRSLYETGYIFAGMLPPTYPQLNIDGFEGINYHWYPIFSRYNSLNNVEADGEVAGYDRLDGSERENLSLHHTDGNSLMRIGDEPRILTSNFEIAHYTGKTDSVIKLGNYYTIHDKKTGVYHRALGVSEKYSEQFYYAYQLPSGRYGNDSAGSSAISLDEDSLLRFNDPTNNYTDYNAVLKIGDTVPPPSDRVLQPGVFGNYERYAFNDIFVNDSLFRQLGATKRAYHYFVEAKDAFADINPGVSLLSPNLHGGEQFRSEKIGIYSVGDANANLTSDYNNLPGKIGSLSDENEELKFNHAPINLSDVQDFRLVKRGFEEPEDKGVNIDDPSVSNYRASTNLNVIGFYRETRVNTGNPGNQKIKTTAGQTHYGQPTNDYDKFEPDTIDKINALDVYKDDGRERSFMRDLVRFKIEALDGDNPSKRNAMLFRAFLDSFSDSYTGDWNSYKYNGRAEDFYTYKGFKRGFDFKFKIAAQTRHEMLPLYRKLNYLLTQTAPDYSGTRMRGSLCRLTIGNYMERVPGFFTKVGLSWNTEFPFEIAINHLENGPDKDGACILPHILEVKCSFQPIHTFIPQKSVSKSPFILPHTSRNKTRQWNRLNERDTVYDAHMGGSVPPWLAFLKEPPKEEKKVTTKKVEKKEETVLVEQPKVENEKIPVTLNNDLLKQPDLALRHDNVGTNSQRFAADQQRYERIGNDLNKQLNLSNNSPINNPNKVFLNDDLLKNIKSNQQKNNDKLDLLNGNKIDFSKLPVGKI